MTLLSNKRMNLLDVFEPGTFHIDSFDLPNPPDDSDRRNLFVAMDQATRWVYMRCYRDQLEDGIADFLLRLVKASPMSIQRIAAESHLGIDRRSFGVCGSHSGGQLFDSACLAMSIDLQTFAPFKPTDCGIVERFTRSFYEQVRQVQSVTADDLAHIVCSYAAAYNQGCQSALAGSTPMRAVRRWRRKRPELFLKKGLKMIDTAPVMHAE